MSNIPLMIFDILLLPITLIRVTLIFLWGSKYNLRGFRFLDVIMHADNPYFNQEDCRVIDTIGKDYRVIIRNDSRLFPIDFNNCIQFENKLTKETKATYGVHEVITGNTMKKKSLWEIDTEKCIEDDNSSSNNSDDSETTDNSSSESESESETETKKDVVKKDVVKKNSVKKDDVKKDVVKDNVVKKDVVKRDVVKGAKKQNVDKLSYLSVGTDKNDNDVDEKDEKGVNYFGDNDEKHEKRDKNNKIDKDDTDALKIVDSAMKELYSAFEDN